MALHHFSSLPISACNFISRPREFIGPILNTARLKRGTNPSVLSNASRSVKCIVHERVSEGKDIIARRSANYQPPIWHFNFLQSLKSEYVQGGAFVKRVENLKEEVREMLKRLKDDPLAQLEHIDILQRLGLSYHFEEEIKSMLEEICKNKSKRNSLYFTALEFRLLRQHGYWVPQEVFNAFRDERGNFSAGTGDNNILAMLSLYEASFHSIKGEDLLEEARDFTTKFLEEYVKRNKDQNGILSFLVNHALELPLHWRMLRLESRWFIDVYERRQEMNPSLLELAKLDFNIVQATHQEDLKHVSRWWRGTGLGEKLDFARDRVMENFMWTVGVAFEPQFGKFRRISTKIYLLLTVIDDIYDVYGTLDELELFTDAVERWDINAMDQLPEYMRMCFFALHNTINDMAFVVLKEQGFNIVKYVKKVWTDLCKAYLLEAKWYYSGYTPNLQEYIENAWISVTVPVMLVHAYFLIENPITKEALDCLEEYPSIIRQSSILIRFADDLGTASDEIKRGDVPKSIQCYMHEAGVSEEKAHRHIKLLIRETWKDVNEDRLDAESPFSNRFIESAANLARVAQCMYLYGDGHASQDRETQERVLSLFVNPIPLNQEN
nr:terpene synthase [Ficus microcarpa]